MTDVHYVLATALLTWLQIMIAAELRTPTWTKAGARLAFGNRESLPAPSAMAARADRAAKNMLENLPLFLAFVLAAKMAGSDPTVGAAIFFCARLAYALVYLAGVIYLRSALWLVALLGLLWIGYGAW